MVGSTSHAGARAIGCSTAADGRRIDALAATNDLARRTGGRRIAWGKREIRGISPRPIGGHVAKGYVAKGYVAKGYVAKGYIV
jgi:hypothetical protein